MLIPQFVFALFFLEDVQLVLRMQGKSGTGWGWLLLLPAGFAGFLGTWQVNRYRWKVDLLEKREAGFQASLLLSHSSEL